MSARTPDLVVSSRARRGKIAALPHHLREELNFRLDDGEPGKSLVDWLNALPEVQAVLERQFEAKPITEQNLSEWRQGGYQDWRQCQNLLERSDALMEHTQDLQEAFGGASLAERLSVLAILELTRLLQLISRTDPEPGQEQERLNTVLAVSKAIAQFRRLEIDAEIVRFKRERAQAEGSLGVGSTSSPSAARSAKAGRSDASEPQLTKVLSLLKTVRQLSSADPGNSELQDLEELAESLTGSTTACPGAGSRSHPS